MLRGFLVALLMLGAMSAQALAQPAARVVSPGNVLAVDLNTDGDGRALYSVTRLGEAVIAPARLGFILVDAPKLERNFTIGEPRMRSADETWELPWGERRFVRNRYNEMRVTLTERSGPRRS